MSVAQHPYRPEVAPQPTRPFGLAAAIGAFLGVDLPIAIDCYDGSHLGPDDASTRLVVRSHDALRYVLTAPGELGFARAYVAGELDVVGDIFEVLALRHLLPDVKVSPREWLTLARTIGVEGLRPLPAPAEEMHPRGLRHSKARDAAAISHHYDVSNEFYRLVLGPSMTYSCAVFASPGTSLEAAQAAKYELVCRKLGLAPGMRLLDIGCGWGGMVMHAARHHGVRAVGVTLSERQAEWARRAVAEAGLAGQVEIRVQDYRDVRDGPYDAISSIGMFEHVGEAKLDEYFARCFALVGARRPPAESRDRRARRAGPGSAGEASSNATCSPTASCTRSGASSRASSTRASRSAMSKGSASTTTRRSATGWRTSSDTGTTPWCVSDPAGRGCGAFTWRLRPAGSATRGCSSTRYSRCATVATARVRCPADLIGSRPRNPIASGGLLVVAAELLAHRRQQLVREVGGALGDEAVEQCGRDHRRGHAFVDRGGNRPSTFARVADPPAEGVEPGRRVQRRGGEVEQPRRHHTAASPDFGDLGHVDVVLVQLGMFERRGLRVGGLLRGGPRSRGAGSSTLPRTRPCSVYSTPLCTIFTKCPEPAGPQCR